MRLLLAAPAVVAFGLTACGGEQATARAAADPGTGAPVVGCASHAEPSLKAFKRGRDTIRGPFALVTSTSTLRRLGGESYEPRRGRDATVKLPVALRAEYRATLRVSPAQRRHAGLTFADRTRGTTRVAGADHTIVFEPCAREAPAFSGGVVGPITGWAGGLIVSGPRCVRLQLWIDGERQSDIALPLGRRCTTPVFAGVRRTTHAERGSLATPGPRTNREPRAVATDRRGARRSPHRPLT